MQHQGRAHMDTQTRDMLLEEQRGLLDRISAPYRRDADAFNSEMLETRHRSETSLMIQLDDVQAKVQEAKFLNQHSDDNVKSNEENKGDSDQFQEFRQKSKKEGFSAEDLKDMFQILKKQKEGINIMNQSINDSTR